MSATHATVHAAVQAQDLEALITLCDSGADLEKLDRNGRTPLLSAVRLGSISMVDALIKRGASISAVDNHERNVLLIAIQHIRDEDTLFKMLKYLLNQGANIEEYDEDGNCALDCTRSKRINELFLANAELLNYARGKDVKRTLEELLLAGASIHVRGNEDVDEDVTLRDVQALHLAIRRRDRKRAEALLDAEAAIDSEDCDQFNAFDYALLSQDCKMIVLCLLHPIKQNLKAVDPLSLKAIEAIQDFARYQFDKAVQRVGATESIKGRCELLNEIGLYCLYESQSCLRQFRDLLKGFAEEAFNKRRYLIDESSFQFSSMPLAGDTKETKSTQDSSDLSDDEEGQFVDSSSSDTLLSTPLTRAYDSHRINSAIGKRPRAQQEPEKDLATKRQRFI